MKLKDTTAIVSSI